MLGDHKAAWTSNARARRRRSSVSTYPCFGGPGMRELLLLIPEPTRCGRKWHECSVG